MSTDINKKDENVETGFVDSIDGLLDTLIAAFSVPEEPIEPLPPPLILVGGAIRPGVSPLGITSNVVARQSEAGLPVGDVFADGPNANEAMIKIIVEEVINALLNDCVVNVVLDAGIPVTSIGANAAGIVLSQGSTTGIAIGTGILR
jgi:hypothetical protein